MVGRHYSSLEDLNGQAVCWCEKINHKIHQTINVTPYSRLSEEHLAPVTREYFINKINLRKVEKDCLISYKGNKYSVSSEYAEKDVAVIGLDNTLSVYYQGIPLCTHKLSYGKNTLNVNREHYKKLIVKQSFDIQNTLLNNKGTVDFLPSEPDLSKYDVLIGGTCNG